MTYGVYLFHLPIRSVIHECWKKLPVVELPPSYAALLIMLLTVAVSMLCADLLNRATTWYGKKR